MAKDLDDLAEKVLKAELKNIVQKVQSGKTLTNAERQIINQHKPAWEKLGIKRRTYFQYKKLGMPEDQELASAWIKNRQAITNQGGQIIIGGKTFTADDLIELRGQLMLEQKNNLQLKNRIETLNVAEREGELLPADELTKTLGQILIPLRKALDQMPENIAGSVNPQDPARAETIITQELNNIYADLVKALKSNEQTSEFRV